MGPAELLTQRPDLVLLPALVLPLIYLESWRLVLSFKAHLGGGGLYFSVKWLR